MLQGVCQALIDLCSVKHLLDCGTTRVLPSRQAVGHSHTVTFWYRGVGAVLQNGTVASARDPSRVDERQPLRFEDGL